MQISDITDTSSPWHTNGLLRRRQFITTVIGHNISPNLVINHLKSVKSLSPVYSTLLTGGTAGVQVLGVIQTLFFKPGLQHLPSRWDNNSTIGNLWPLKQRRRQSRKFNTLISEMWKILTVEAYSETSVVLENPVHCQELPAEQ